jgi:hypothetical protein
MKQMLWSLCVVFVLGAVDSCGAADGGGDRDKKSELDGTERGGKQAVFDTVVPLETCDILDDAVRSYIANHSNYNWPLVAAILEKMGVSKDLCVLIQGYSLKQFTAIISSKPLLANPSMWDGVHLTFSSRQQSLGKSRFESGHEGRAWDSGPVQLAVWAGAMAHPCFQPHAIAKGHIQLIFPQGNRLVPLITNVIDDQASFGFQALGSWNIISRIGRREGLEADIRIIGDYMHTYSLLPHEVSVYCAAGNSQQELTEAMVSVTTELQQYVKSTYRLSLDHIDRPVYTTREYDTTESKKAWRMHVTIPIDPRGLHTFVQIPLRAAHDALRRYRCYYGKNTKLPLADIISGEDILSHRHPWDPCTIQKLHLFENDLFTQTQNNDLSEYTKQVLWLRNDRCKGAPEPEMFFGETSYFERRYAPWKTIATRFIRPDMLFPAYSLVAICAAAVQDDHRWKQFALLQAVTSIGYIGAAIRKGICSPFYTSPIKPAVWNKVSYSTIGLFVTSFLGSCMLMSDSAVPILYTVPPLCAAALHYYVHHQS